MTNIGGLWQVPRAIEGLTNGSTPPYFERDFGRAATIGFPMGQSVQAFEGNLTRTDPLRHPSNPTDVYPMSGIGTIT
jgi:hypothetical protein